MKIVVRDVENNMDTIDINDIHINDKYVISIDGSTTVTGVSIISLTRRPLYTLAFEHERDIENAIHYKVKLKKELLKLILSNLDNLEYIFYEQPFIGYAQAAKNLFMLSTCIEELKFENEEQLGCLKYKDINNLKWKKQFLAPIKCPSGTELQKKAVYDKLKKLYPQLFTVKITQDEVDATAMGLIGVDSINNGKEEELDNKKSLRPFKYNIEFIGADYDDVIFSDIESICNTPKKVLENGIIFDRIDSRVNLDKKVYELMGSDDKLLILKFSSNTNGNLILKHNIGEIANTYDYIYMFIWRKTRKRGRAE